MLHLQQKHLRNLILLSALHLLLGCRGELKITANDKEKILLELEEIQALDQKYAGLPPADLTAQHGNKKAWEIFKEKRDSIGLANQKRIKDLFEQYGFLGVEKIGEAGATAFWLPIQHADNDIPFQQEILEAMEKEIENGNADKYHYAMLEDRINVNLNQPQRFGSQVTYNEVGQAIPKFGLADSASVDSLRKEFSLPALKEYYNQMTMMHFEMNKEMFLEQGITEPQLYK
ncbi:DUF6624 domain-containing protein [Robertkochia flava]|uniref:DUF6624 domain-containing protein n=1 Tax=Robertkochia flava TaxID=3447986 RepID=UPI001CCB1B0A|nr:DUF6624 domain-containing protein [Robertkochia marina]